MNLKTNLKLLVIGSILTLSGLAFAQRNGNIPELIPFPGDFETSREHYDYLLDQYKGGVAHDYMSVPKWEGLWSAGGDSGIRSNAMFRDEDGEIYDDVLTPEYKAAWEYRLGLGDQA